MARFALGLALVLPWLAGCGAPSQADVERTVRDGMKVERGVEVKEVNLTQQPGGAYTGTATADNGDTYDVVVDRPRAGKVRWRATATQPTVERLLRERIERTHGSPVAKLELTRESEGSYYGTFTLEAGTRWTVTANTEGVELKWQASLIP
jgi:hypothetical protein